MDSDKVSTSSNDTRKSAKPIMEKKRRARINASLAELKSLLLEVIKKEGTRHSKMEKADILEMTVNHLRLLQRQHMTVPDTTAEQAAFINKYQLGFNECATEVSRYLSNMDGMDVDLRTRLLNHLANCVTKCSPDAQPLAVSIPSPCNVTSTTPEILTAKLTSSPSTSKCEPGAITISVAGKSVTQTDFCNGTVITQPPRNTITLPQNNSMILLPKPPILQQAAPQTIITQSASGSFATVQGQQNLQVANVVSGIQLLPTKIPTGEIALVLPASLLNSSQIPSYVIPIYSTPSVNLSAMTVSSAVNSVPQMAIKTSTTPILPQPIAITNIAQAPQATIVQPPCQQLNNVTLIQQTNASIVSPVAPTSQVQTVGSNSPQVTTASVVCSKQDSANGSLSQIGGQPQQRQLDLATVNFSPIKLPPVIKPEPIPMAPIPLVFPYHNSPPPAPSAFRARDHIMPVPPQRLLPEEDGEDVWRPW